jgi:ribokinase
MTQNVAIFVVGSFVAACSAKVSHLPRPGESLPAESFLLEAGGKGFNLAAGARRLGVAVDGLLAIGDDLFSTLAEPALSRAGLPLGMLVRHPGVTGAGIGFVDAKGENCLAVFPGANAKLSASDVTAAASRIRQSGMVLAQFEITDAPIRAAFAQIRQSGGISLLNPSPYRSIARDLLSVTSVLVVNRHEAALLAKDFGFEFDADRGTETTGGFGHLARALFGHGLNILVVTLGERGAIAWRNGEDPIRQPAFTVDAIDTMGAGDAFTAAFATHLLERQPLSDCLIWGAASGAFAAQRQGVLDALPTRDALDAFITQQRHSA